MISTVTVRPEDFTVRERDPNDEDQFVFEGHLPYQSPVHLESPIRGDLGRRAVEETVLFASSAQAAPSTLIVETGRRSTSVELPLRADFRGIAGYRIETADDVESLRFELDDNGEGRVTVNINVRYTGLQIDKALTYARFMSALYSEQGTLSVGRGGPDGEKIPLLELPLPLEQAAREDAEQTLRFAEVLDEIGSMAGTQFVYPSETGDEDLKNLNHVLAAIRGGWVALPVKEFTTPMDADGVRNILNLITEEGGLRSLAMTSEGERFKVFDTWIDLGPSIRYVSGVQLVTPRSELENWLAEDPERGDSFDIRWAPVDEARVQVFYQEWPKPSPGARREDLQAFEDEYSISSEEFRRAWRAGEQWAQELEGGDVWLTLLDAEDYFSQLSQEA